MSFLTHHLPSNHSLHPCRNQSRFKMSIFLQIRTSVRVVRSLSSTLRYRSMSSRYNSEDTPKPHSATELYEQACERSARLEQQWMLSRKNVQETSGNSPITFPSYWRGTKDEFGPCEVNNRTEAQKAVERHSKYAWVSSFFASLPQTTLKRLSSLILAGA